MGIAVVAPAGDQELAAWADVTAAVDGVGWSLDEMRAVNERLCYVERPAWRKLVAPVDVVEAALAR